MKITSFRKLFAIVASVILTHCCFSQDTWEWENRSTLFQDTVVTKDPAFGIPIIQIEKNRIFPRDEGVLWVAEKKDTTNKVLHLHYCCFHKAGNCPLKTDYEGVNLLDWRRYDWMNPREEGYVLVKEKTSGELFHAIINYHPYPLGNYEKEKGAITLAQSSSIVFDSESGESLDSFLTKAIPLIDDFLQRKIDLPAWVGKFYDGVAVAEGYGGEWYYINEDGIPIYKERFSFAAPFVDDVARVKDKDGHEFHICKDGAPLYKKRFHRVGPFQNGVAEVQNNRGKVYFIDHCGQKIRKKKALKSK